MTATQEDGSALSAQPASEASALALRLAHAENALLALTSGQVDAIVDASGKAYLLRPAQEQLRQRERRLRAILDSTSDVITVVNRGGSIVSQNGAVIQVLGFRPDELVGSSFFDLIHEEDLPRVHTAFLHVVEAFHESATVQFRHRKQNDSYRLIEATAGRLIDGASTNVVFSLRPCTMPASDRTPVVLQEIAPVAAPSGRDRFLAMLSHELRAPLSPIMYGIDHLQEDERFAEARPTLSMIRRNIKLQLRLLEELVDFTTLGAHKVRLRPESLDAHEAVHFVLELCESEIIDARIEVLLDLSAAESVVRVDSARLQQVMWNLVKNAVKFSTPGSSISISSANDSTGHLTLDFADHGVGIEPELLPLVFDPFQQGDHWMQQLSGGLGLGLFIAKGLTDAQGGTLTVESKGRGKGATFRLTHGSSATAEQEPAMLPL